MSKYLITNRFVGSHVNVLAATKDEAMRAGYTTLIGRNGNSDYRFEDFCRDYIATKIEAP